MCDRNIFISQLRIRMNDAVPSAHSPFMDSNRRHTLISNKFQVLKKVGIFKNVKCEWIK